MKITSASHRSYSGIEMLESRIAPASVITYTDTDGDVVRIISTHGNLAGHATFDDNSDHHQLQTLDLTDPSFSNTSIIVRVQRAPGGDGEANIGYINATGNDLTNVVVPGDLGRISAGDGNAGHLAINKLLVRSMGALGTSTQAGGTPLVDFGALTDTVTQLLGSPASGVTGTLPTLLQEVTALLERPDLSDAARRVLAQFASDGQALISDVGGMGGTLSSFTGGVGQLLSTLQTDLGKVTSLGQANPGLLGTDLTGLLGTTSSQLSPLVALNGSPSTVSLDLTGLLGNVLGGPGSSPAADLLSHVGTALNNVTPGLFSGLTPGLSALLGKTGPEVTNILNGSSPVTAGALHDLALLQSTLASSLSTPGEVAPLAQGVLAPLSQAITDLLGESTGAGTGGAPTLVTSNLNGGVGQFSSRFDVDGVFLNVNGNLGRAFIGGSLLAGSSADTGELFASGNVGRVTIGGNLVGGDNLNTGLVHAGGRVGGIAIGGSLLGGAGNNSGAVALQSDIGSVVIRGDVTGHDGLFSGSVIASDGSIRALGIRGSLISGADGASASLSATNSIGTLSIAHGVFADSTHRAAITAGAIHSQTGGQDRGFNTIGLRGVINDLDLMAGYDLSLDPVNGSAGIGRIGVVGNVTASNIVAGAMTATGSAEDFGTDTDRLIAERNAEILSRISAIVVRGNVFGSSAAGDHFGIEAGEIDRVVVNGGPLPMAAGPANDTHELSTGTGDVTVREVSAAA